MQAHPTSSVVMDIAAFEVSHSSDINATALRAARARSSSIHRGNGTLHAWVRFSAKLTMPCHDTPPTVSIPLGRWMKYHGRFKMQALTFWDAKVTSTCTTAGQFKCQFKGGMEELSQKVQNANTHILQRHNHGTRTHSNRSVQGSVQGGDG